MLQHPTVDKLHALRLPGMAAALAEQQSQDGIDRLSFEERLGLLVEREASERDSRQTAARLRRARLKIPDASPEDIDYRTARGLDRALTARLLTGEWLRERQNLILPAPATFDPDAFGDGRLDPYHVVTTTVAHDREVTLPAVRFVCRADVSAFEGTESVSIR